MLNKYNLALSVASSVCLYLAVMRPVFSDLNFIYFLLFALVINTLTVTYLLKFNIKMIRRKWDYYILPTLHVIGVFFFISFFVNPLVKFFIVLLFGISMYVIHQSLSSCLKKDIALPIESRNVLTILSMVTIFFCSVLIFNFYSYWEAGPLVLALLHFIVIYGINHFLLKQMLVAPNLYSSLYNFIISLVVAETAFVLNYWSVNYPGYNPNKLFAHLGVPVGSMMVLIVYYCLWGLTYYLIEGRLTKKVMYEYLLISFIAFVFVLLTTRWIPIF